MFRIQEAIVVEGRYDKNTLSQLVDTVILETAGFGVFQNAELVALLRRLARTRGLIVLTDSDGAGFLIRGHLKSALPAQGVKHAYIPDVPGKDMEPSIQISLRACGEPALLRVVRTSVDPAVDLFDLLSEVVKLRQHLRLEERNRHGDHGQGQNTAGVLDGLVRVRDYGIDGSSHDVSPEKGESPGH